MATVYMTNQTNQASASSLIGYTYSGSNTIPNGGMFTIGTTMDMDSGVTRPVEWNGSVVSVGPPPPPVVPPKSESPLTWLHRRVEEMQVDLMAEAA